MQCKLDSWLYMLCCMHDPQDLGMIDWYFFLGAVDHVDVVMGVGVTKVDIAVTTKTVRVRHVQSKASPGVLVSALNQAGLIASLGETEQGSGE